MFSLFVGWRHLLPVYFSALSAIRIMVIWWRARLLYSFEHLSAGRVVGDMGEDKKKEAY
jgi:hypothetical protein